MPQLLMVVLILIVSSRRKRKKTSTTRSSLGICNSVQITPRTLTTRSLLCHLKTTGLPRQHRPGILQSAVVTGPLSRHIQMQSYSLAPNNTIARRRRPLENFLLSYWRCVNCGKDSSLLLRRLHPPYSHNESMSSISELQFSPSTRRGTIHRYCTFCSCYTHLRIHSPSRNWSR